jgi:hypothetical protein
MVGRRGWASTATGGRRGAQRVAASDRLRPPRRPPPFFLSVRARRRRRMAGREREEVSVAPLRSSVDREGSHVFPFCPTDMWVPHFCFYFLFFLFCFPVPHHRHVGRGPSQIGHVGATSAKPTIKTAEGKPLRDLFCTGFNS